MKRNYVFKVIVLILTISMFLTTVVFAFNFTAPGQWKAPGQMKKYLRNQYGYEKAAEYMQMRKIIKGYGNGNFGYEDYVKRSDIAVMVFRAFNLSLLVDKDDLNEDFLDVVNDSYYYYPVQIAKKLGIAKGDGKNFKPKDFVTIQEAIWLIERSVKAVGDKLEFEDVKLEDLFDEKELNEFAKRQDIALMLYYVLTANELDENENADIILTMYNDSLLKFKDKWFIDALDNIKVEDEIEYVKFALRDESKGKLYYEYEENEKKTLISDKTKYYLGDEQNNIVENITFIPKKDFTGTLTIGYNAFTKDGKSYPGLIKITINNREVLKTIPTLKLYEDYEEEEIVINFVEEIKKLVDGKLFDDFDYVKFEVPQSGTLKIKLENLRYKPINDKTAYEIQIIENIKYIFEDEETVDLNYKIYIENSKADKAYEGLIKIIIE